MGEFRVTVTDSAKKDLRKLSPELRKKLLQNLKILEISPFATIKPIKKIKTSRKIALYRFRFSEYRVIYHIREDKVYILAVIHRRDFEKGLKSILKVG